jgi:hypothetical protein
VWGITAKGSKVPMDLPEKRYIQGRSGRYIMVDTHTPHHATCPEVDMFRKEKKDDPLHGDDQTPR